MNTVLLEQILELRSAFCHDIKQVSRDCLPIAKGEEPDFSSDRPRDALIPEMPQMMLVLVMVPGREYLLLPRRYCLLQPGLLL